jgi:hypothetical protein
MPVPVSVTHSTTYCPAWTSPNHAVGWPHACTGEHGIRGAKQAVEHAALPLGQRVGARRRHVSHGEQVELPQAFAIAQLARKVLYRTWITQVAANRHHVHRQVVEDEVRDVVDLLLGKTETLQNGFCHVRATLRVVASADGFAHVVQQGGHEQNFRACDLGGQSRGQRVQRGVFTPDECAQAVDGSDLMHVDRVDVIKVVMHSTHQRCKLGNHRQNETCVVQLGEY